MNFPTDLEAALIRIRETHNTEALEADERLATLTETFDHVQDTLTFPTIRVMGAWPVEDGPDAEDHLTVLRYRRQTEIRYRRVEIGYYRPLAGLWEAMRPLPVCVEGVMLRAWDQVKASGASLRWLNLDHLEPGECPCMDLADGVVGTDSRGRALITESVIHTGCTVEASQEVGARAAS